ncbi:MAG: ABC transporter ATP-binding protein [Candidatus Eremiobacteraeota bacterium]|nr:ABC transporter ATP-binding protein [Candidatus Eremiobacteraeota bacterium]
MTAAQLRFAGVGKRYGKTRVLEDVNLEVGEGELFVLLGPSGCGKTTLLRITAGLLEPSSGEIYLRDEPISRVPPERRNVAMVFQDYALYPHMTVYRNMAFGLRRHGVGREETDERIRRTAGMLSIEGLLERRPHQLSGGQQQRVALGRAIVRNPALYLMDEPLSNLDAQVRSTVRTEIKELQRNLGVTTLYVTHDQLEAMTLAHRLAILNEGVVQQIGPPIEVYREPANEFVARFLASPRLNLIAGTVEYADGFVAVRTTLGTFRWPSPPAQPPPAGTNVRVGLRPEELKTSFAFDGGAPAWPVRLVEPLGAQVLVFAQVGGDEVIAAINADALPARAERIAFRPAGSVVHLFHPTGRALAHFVSA